MTPHQQIARVLGLLPQGQAKIAAAIGVHPSVVRGWRQVASGSELGANRSGRAAPTDEHLAAAWRLLEAHGREVAAVIGPLAPAPGDKALASALDASRGEGFRRFRALEAARERVEAACEALALAAGLGDDAAADRAVALRVVVGLTARPR